MFITAISIVGCERELILKPEEPPAQQSFPTESAITISFDETSITTEQPEQMGSEGKLARSADNARSVLKNYARTHRKMKIDQNGKPSLEVRYLEGNSDIQIPMSLYNRIKDRLHPPDPNRKPITRFTIENDLYTGYGEDGSVVYQFRFRSGESSPEGMSSLSKQALSQLATQSSRITGEPLLQSLSQAGVPYRRINDREVLVEKRSATKMGAYLSKEVLDLSTGLVVRSVVYGPDNKALHAVKYRYETINDVSFPSYVVTYSYGKLPNGSWGVRETTIEQRTNISVQMQ